MRTAARAAVRCEQSRLRDGGGQPRYAGQHCLEPTPVSLNNTYRFEVLKDEKNQNVYLRTRGGRSG